MNLLQIKFSDTFKEDIEILKYQVSYVKENFSYLFNISISCIYLSYLSIYKKPKLFASSNKERTFLYDTKKDIFVDFDGQEYGEFPILNGATIYRVEESVIINKLLDDLIEYNSEKIYLKEKKWIFQNWIKK